MNRTMKQAIAWLMVLGIVLAGCAAPIETQAPPTETATPSRAPTATPTSESTSMPTREVASETPTTEPSTTAILTPTLAVREPSVDQLKTYLESVFPDDLFINYYAGPTETTVEDMTGDGKPDTVVRTSYGQLLLEVTYTDISGDGTDDLIALIPAEVFTLIWSNDQYAEPFREAKGYVSWTEPSSVVSFEDWTNDGIPEVVFDDDDVSVYGTGILGTYTTRHIIYCEGTKCRPVWQGTLSARTDDINFGGLDRYQVEMRQTTDKNGKPAIRTVDGGFSVYCCSDSNNEHINSLIVYTSTLSLYSWNGSIFDLTGQQVVSRAHMIDSQAHLSATDANGISAAISAEFNNWADSGNDVCQLLVGGKAIGSRFGCKQNFTAVEWEDITNDGLPEIVVIALSGSSPRDTFANGGELLSDVGCVHQHLLAYQWNGNTATEIANVAGCVVREDLYGVRLEDFDQDGQLELLAAAGSEHPRDQIYKWNGTKFVFWDDVPGQ